MKKVKTVLSKSILALLFSALTCITNAQSPFITVGTGVTLTNEAVVSFGTLTIDGTITGDGTFTGSQIATIIGGPAGVATLKFTPGGFNNYVRDVTLNGANVLTLGNELNVVGGTMPNTFGTVTANGTSVLNSAGFLVFKSDAGGTARYASSAGTISGNVTVERYIPANRAWRFLTAPTFGSRTIKQDWQEDGHNTSTVCANNDDPHPGFGTQITNKNSVNGFDLNLTQNPSIFWWNGTGWTVPLSTDATPINSQRSWCIFVRGPRSNCLDQGIGAIPAPTVLRTIGSLQNGTATIIITGLTNGQFVFIGNPHVSAVDLIAAMDAPGSGGFVKYAIWAWDPAYGINGGYASYFNGSMAPTSTPNYISAAMVPIIQSGQGFFLQANGAGTITLNFPQSTKTATQYSVFGRVAHAEVTVDLRDSIKLLDGATLQFDSAVEGGATKLYNNYESIYLTKNGQKFAIRANPFRDSDTTPIEFNGMKQHSYFLKLNANTLCTDSVTVVLQDRKLGVDVPITDSLTYKFEVVTADTSTYKNRFLLITSRRAQPTPPVLEAVNKLTAGPNPVVSMLAVRGVEGYVKITNITGMKVFFMKTNEKQANIDFSSWPSGLYYLSTGGNSKPIGIVKQ